MRCEDSSFSHLYRNRKLVVCSICFVLNHMLSRFCEKNHQARLKPICNQTTINLAQECDKTCVIDGLFSNNYIL